MKYFFLFLSVIFFNNVIAQSAFSKAIEKCLPAVFLIRTYDINDNEIGLGTGFFIDSIGEGVTNYHVLAGASKAIIETADGKTLPIERIWAIDKVHDVLGFSIQNNSRQKFKYLNLNTKSPQLGEEVFTIGNPKGLSLTSANGIVSSVRNDSELGTMIQTTTPISSGSSGSPLMNLKNQVIGIISFSYINGQNLNFAFSAKYISELIDNGAIYPFPVADDEKEGKTMNYGYLMKAPWNAPQSVVISQETGILKNERIGFKGTPILEYQSSLFGRPCMVNYRLPEGVLQQINYVPLLEKQNQDGNSDFHRIKNLDDAWRIFIIYYGELSFELGVPNLCESGIKPVRDLVDTTNCKIAEWTLENFKDSANLKFDEFEVKYPEKFQSDMNNLYLYRHQITWQNGNTEYSLILSMSRYFIISKDIDGEASVFLIVSNIDK